ncbi:MAG: hypothetical protein IME92_04240 [Proteobacteria bacterium]|nr:hypothetical protein [Pseudomonadota bacterium]
MAFILAVCLIVQGFMMALHGPMGAMADTGDRRIVVLCTVDGIRHVTLDESGVPVDDENTPVQGVRCPLCTAAANMVLALPESNDFAFAPTSKDLFETPVEVIPATDRRPDNLNCLDPPFQA